jgi:hypothetical protein
MLFAAAAMRIALYPTPIGVIEMRKSALLFLLAALALPALGANRITVEQLEKAVAAAHGRPDKEVARSLGEMELTERLSAARLKRLKADMHGEKAQLALLALADASAFLDLPAGDMPQLPVPDSAAQSQIITRSMAFVVATVSKMPDFFATRTTTRFQDMKVSRLLGDPILIENQSFEFIDRLSTPVTYRNGREVLEAPGAKKRGSSVTSTTGLSNWGVFGPLLGVVMADILKGKVGWGHWEQGPAGPLAVFRYAVPEDRSNYTVRYCCFRSAQGEMREFEAIPAYHGEIAIDPASGAVLRLVLKTDLQPALPMERSDVVVEYGPVEIGGKTYICPVESASITKADALVFHGNLLYVDRKGKPDDWVGNKLIHTESVSVPQMTAINDAVFEDYHEFRGEMRILPADGAEQEGNPPSSVPATAPKPPPVQ